MSTKHNPPKIRTTSTKLILKHKKQDFYKHLKITTYQCYSLEYNTNKKQHYLHEKKQHYLLVPTDTITMTKY